MGAAEQSPTTPGRARPPPEPSPIVLLIGGPLARANVPGLSERLRAVLQAGERGEVICDVSTLTEPDVGTVDALARLQLAARRLGCQIRLRHASCELQELLALAGLGDVVPLSAGSPLELDRQTEEREQARGVEERVDLDDPTA